MEIDVSKLFDANSIIINEDISSIDSVLEYEEILLCISKAIIKYRKDKNLTQKELAEILNINQVMVSKLERGNYNPTMKLLHTISRKLTESSDLLINILKDIITNLYKTKNIEYTLKTYETYKYNLNKKDENNVIYFKNNVNINNYGGMIYGEINSTSQLSVNG